MPLAEDGPIDVQHHGKWCEVRLNRPDKRNAISSAVADQIARAFAEAAAKEEAVVLLSAAGPVFCAGGDRSEVAQSAETPTVRLIDLISRVEQATVALVEGPAVGGALAVLACCPVVIASRSSWYSLPEVDMGMFAVGPAPYLETVLSPRVVAELGMTGRRMSAEEALAVGLVSAVHEPSTVREAALGRVADLVRAPSVAEQARRYWQQRFQTEQFGELRERTHALFSQEKQ